MNLALRLSSSSWHPVSALLIRGEDASRWLPEIERMKLRSDTITLYPVPGVEANSIYGCLVISSQLHGVDAGRNEKMQCVHHLVYIPEKTELYPEVEKSELSELLKGKLYCWHPEAGLCMLEEPLKMEDCFSFGGFRKTNVITPLHGFTETREVKSFEIIPVSPDETIDRLENEIFPQSEKMKDEPLSTWEKIKLTTYRGLFKTTPDGKGNVNIEKTTASSALDKLKKLFGGKGKPLSEKWQMDMEELERRNQSQMDKLMKLFNDNIDEALKYAIPLDNDGHSRGGQAGLMDLNKRWNGFSLFQNTPAGRGGATTLSGDTYLKLHNQYLKAAEELIKQGEHEKAAFIYMKLMKNPYQAATTLNNGGFHEEAASIYLKYCNNTLMAANAYEQGKMYREAIGLHKEMNNNEKVGDLYICLKEKEEAHVYYNKVIDKYLLNNQYVIASKLLKGKMEDTPAAQRILKKGWLENGEAYNCLLHFMENIQADKEAKKELENIYLNEMTDDKKPVFLKILKKEFSNRVELHEPIKKMAYEIVVDKASSHPELVDEIKHFERKDSEISKDIMKWKFRSR